MCLFMSSNHPFLKTISESMTATHSVSALEKAYFVAWPIFISGFIYTSTLSKEDAISTVLSVDPASTIIIRLTGISRYIDCKHAFRNSSESFVLMITSINSLFTTKLFLLLSLFSKTADDVFVTLYAILGTSYEGLALIY